MIGDAMYARSGTLQVQPDQIDAAVDAIRAQMPHYHQAQGFRGFRVIADRSSGKVIGMSFWDTEADRDASDELGAQARRAAQEAGSSPTEVVRELWEVVLDETA
jgi:heme-degrading monooxygenase HmoA